MAKHRLTLALLTVTFAFFPDQLSVISKCSVILRGKNKSADVFARDSHHVAIVNK